MSNVYMNPHKNVNVFVRADGKPHLCKITVYENHEVIEWVSGSEPEGKEAVEFAEWVDNNWWRKGNTNIWADMIGEEGAIEHTTEQLYKIWKAEAK